MCGRIRRGAFSSALAAFVSGLIVSVSIAAGGASAASTDSRNLTITWHAAGEKATFEPINYELGSFAMVSALDLSALDQQTHSLLSSIAAFAEKSKLLRHGSVLKEDDYRTYESDFFVSLKDPLRPDVDAAFSTLQTDLKPIDFKNLGTINYGAKVAWAPLDFRSGIAYYRGIDSGINGSAVHVEGDVGPLSLGLTNVVANHTGPSTSNVYLTRLHSANLVGAASLREGDTLQSYLRYGSVGAAHDMLLIESFSKALTADRLLPDGTYLTPHAALGFRRIDGDYTPLDTAFDPLVGTRSVFGQVGLKLTAPSGARNPSMDLTVGGVRSFDVTQVRYADGFAKLSATLDSKKTFDVSGTFDRSSIAGSVVARTGGLVVVPDTLGGSTLLRNDLKEFDLTYAPEGNKVLKVAAKAGLAWRQTPACSPKAQPLCSVAYTRNVTGSFKAASDPVTFEFTVGPADRSAAEQNQKTAPTSELAVVGALSFLVGNCVKVTSTYSNNAAENTGTAFVLGNSFEEQVQFVPPIVQRLVELKLRHAYGRNFEFLPQVSTGINVSFDPFSHGSDKSDSGKTDGPSLLDRCAAARRPSPH